MIKKTVFVGLLLLGGFWLLSKARTSKEGVLEQSIPEEVLLQKKSRSQKEIPIIQAPEIPQVMPLKEKVETIEAAVEKPVQKMVDVRAEQLKVHKAKREASPLDLPQPKSIEELIGKVTEYKNPRTVGGAVDGSITTLFRGYFEDEKQKLKKIQLYRYIKNGIDFDLRIEEKKGQLSQWKWNERSPENGEIKAANFNKDPYSLVVHLPDRRVLYLKYSRESIENFRRKTRVMRGWLMIPSANQKLKALRGVLVDLDAIDLQDREDDFPPSKLIKSLLPLELPEKSPVQSP